jgi:hypothetical protein
MELLSLVTLISLFNCIFASNNGQGKVGQPSISTLELEQKRGNLRKTNSAILPSEEQIQRALEEEELRSDKQLLRHSSIDPQGLQVTKKYLKEAKGGEAVHKIPGTDLKVIREAIEAERKPTKPATQEKQETLTSIQASNKAKMTRTRQGADPAQQPQTRNQSRSQVAPTSKLGRAGEKVESSGETKLPTNNSGHQEGAEKPFSTKKLTHLQRGRVTKGPSHRPPTIGRKNEFGVKGTLQRAPLPFAIIESNDNEVLPIESTDPLNIAVCGS